MENKYNEIEQKKTINMDYIDVIKIIESGAITTISFDIFDTLLVRPSVNPKDIFYLLQDKVEKEYGLDFVGLRYDAEDKLGEKNATLEEIWSYIASKKHIDSKTATLLMQEEVELELSLLIPREDMKKIYEAAVACGIDIIATSDMYLDSGILKRALEKNGFEKVKSVYVSCEYHCRKDEGNLYNIVLEQEKIQEPYKLLHIGDNFESDFKIPLKKGIMAVYYPSIWKIIWENTQWGELYKTAGISSDPYMRLLYSYSFLFLYNADRNKVFSEKIFADLKSFSILFLAPLVLAVAIDMVNNDEIRNTYQKLNFAARDGYLPKMIYDIVSSGKDQIPSMYLPVSRQALSFIDKKDFFDYFDNNEWGYNTYYLENFIGCYLTDDTLKAYILSSLSQEEKKIDLHINQLACRKVLWRFRKELNTYFADQKKKAVIYYNAVFNTGQKREIVFDCGYSGSVSRGLCSACGEKIYFDKYYLWETKKNKSNDRKKKTKTFCFFENEPSLGLCIILEECFSPLQESCSGFSGSEKDITPLVKDLVTDSKMKSDMSIMHKTCVEYATGFMELYGKYIKSICLKDRELFINIGYKGFLFSEYMELEIFRNIKFTDPCVAGIPLSLSSKVYDIFEKYNAYVTPFDGTCFNNPESSLRCSTIEAKAKCKIGIHLHLYNTFIYEEIFGYLKVFPYIFDFYITITDPSIGNILKKVFTKNTIPNLNLLTVIVVPNKGRDIAPWILYTKEQQKNYDYFCHVHAKVSKQYSDGFGDRWRKYLFDNLLSRKVVIDIIETFQGQEKLGCVFPEFYQDLKNICVDNKISLFGVDGERKMIDGLLKAMESQMCFGRGDTLWSAGTMLWYRPNALLPLFELDLHIDDFPDEPVGVGGTIMHAMERMVSVIPKNQGFYTKTYSFKSKEGLNKNIPMVTIDIGVRGALRNWLYKHLKPKKADFLCRVCRLK